MSTVERRHKLLLRVSVAILNELNDRKIMAKRTDVASLKLYKHVMRKDINCGKCSISIKFSSFKL
jgi:hypothetical protein